MFDYEDKIDNEGLKEVLKEEKKNLLEAPEDLIKELEKL